MLASPYKSVTYIYLYIHFTTKGLKLLHYIQAKNGAITIAKFHKVHTQRNFPVIAVSLSFDGELRRSIFPSTCTYLEEP